LVGIELTTLAGVVMAVIVW